VLETGTVTPPEGNDVLGKPGKFYATIVTQKVSLSMLDSASSLTRGGSGR
jgi:hypothetical protein